MPDVDCEKCVQHLDETTMDPNLFSTPQHLDERKVTRSNPVRSKALPPAPGLANLTGAQHPESSHPALELRDIQVMSAQVHANNET